jgi:hypothetical protein
MAWYTSHIYAKPKRTLIAFLQSQALLSGGLFYLNQWPSSSTSDIAPNGFPKDGLIVIREVCDPSKSNDSHDEAQVHESDGAPILSWWELQGPQDAQVIPPPPIPTLAFGTIYYNYETNPAPPLKFLRFLKYLSTTHETLIVFYHHYTAYEDRLADSEYAWVFDKQDSVYIRHVAEPYKTIQYTNGESQVIHTKRTHDQPILHAVMQRFGVTLSAPSQRPYFSFLDWDKYKVRMD